ncbi:unnamed protein product [Rotaria sp. Silwood1]|nr:unnamed protein product [Rotaria sp. Silwood1]CAF1597146.1 unnamed protein product [Rotaria sp. Silwood1]
MSFLAKIDAQMNYILLLIRQITKSSKKKIHKLSIKESLSIFTENHKNENVILSLSTSKNNNQKKNLSNNSHLTLEDNQSDLITFENFPFSHICNRDIRHLPLLKRNDIDLDRLRSCYILTMTDLIGRYLIHKTPEEFRYFLIEKVKCSQSFTDEIMQLLYIWTLHNLQIGRGTRTTTLKQYL